MGGLAYAGRPTEQRSSQKGCDILFAVREAAGKRKAIVCLNTFHTAPPAGVPLEAGGGVGGLL